MWNIPAIRRRPTCYTNNDLSLSPVARRSHKNPKLLCTMAEACHVISGANWRQRTHYAGSQHASSRASQITLRNITPRVTQLPSADLKRSARSQTLTAQPNSERAAERSTRAHERTQARNHAHTRERARTSAPASRLRKQISAGGPIRARDHALLDARAYGASVVKSDTRADSKTVM